jgi:putative membrane protein
MLLVHPLRQVARLLPLLVGIVLAGTSTGRGGLWGLMGAGIAIALGVLRWFTTTYRVAAGQVQVRRGLLQRQVVSVALDRVRTVDISASAMHRVLGLVRLNVGTGLSDRKSHDALRLDGLSAVEGASLRDKLLRRQPGEATLSEEAVEEELAVVPPSWSRYGPFTLSGFLTVFVVVGFAWRIVSEAHIDPRRLGSMTAAYSTLAAVPRWLDLVAGPLALLVVVGCASMIGYLLAFWRFRLVRNATGALQVTRGLISTRATTIEGRRLRGVEISEPLLLRAIAGARCLAIATGLRVGRGAERGGTVLLPPGPRAEAQRVAAAVLRSSEPVASQLIRHSAAAHRRRYTRMLAFWVSLTVVLLALPRVLPAPAWSWAVAVVTFPLGIALAYDRYRSLGHQLVVRSLVTRQGSLVRRRCMLEWDGIIGWNLNQSFFQRRAGVATLVATTAAGRQQYGIQDVSVDEAVRIANEAVPDLVTPFLVSEERPSSAARSG